MPFTVVCADFQQLPPVGSGGLCRKFCERMQTIELDTVYRTTDPEHILFLNRICEKQPTKTILREYFEGRHWQHNSLEWYVARSLEAAVQLGRIFTWLTATNAGAEEVCTAALRHLGISEGDLVSGSACDPQTKSCLRILARPGILLCMSRNLGQATRLRERSAGRGGCISGRTQYFRRQAGCIGQLYSCSPDAGERVGILAMLLWVCDHDTSRPRRHTGLRLYLF